MKITLFRIGNDVRPASYDDIEDFKKSLEEAREKGQSHEDICILSHHCVDMQQITLDKDFQIVILSKD